MYDLSRPAAGSAYDEDTARKSGQANNDRAGILPHRVDQLTGRSVDFNLFGV
jgi:hypothetical protein